MNEGRLAHHARGRRNASGQPDREMVQLLVRELEFVTRGLALIMFPRFKTAELFDDGTDGIFASGFDNLGAVKLVRVHIPDKFTQRVEVFAPRGRLIVLFNEWTRQGSRLQSKAMIMLDSMHG